MYKADGRQNSEVEKIEKVNYSNVFGKIEEQKKVADVFAKIMAIYEKNQRK